MAKVYHAEIFGTREAKYNWLNKNDIKKVNWNKLEPKSEFYLFIHRDEESFSVYENFVKITEIFDLQNVGIVTARDNLTIQYTKDDVWNVVRNFANLEPELARETYKLGKDVRDWKVKLAQQDLKESGLDKNKIVPILYRPFDIRYTYFTGKSRGFHCMPRGETMRQMIKVNIGILISRQLDKSGVLPSFVTENIIDGHSITSAVSITYILPLYKNPENNGENLFCNHESGEKKPNIKQELFVELKAKYKKEVTPEEIFYYIYAVLYSNTYRTKYAEFLKIDFPRIPFTSNYKLFIKLGKLGKQLADLHLLKSDELNKPISKLLGKGDYKVTQRPKYEEEKVYINGSKYFSNVKEEVWKYQIGGYQVCDKWLKDRKDRELSLEEIQTYCKIVTALSKTIELQKEIDENYEGVEN